MSKTHISEVLEIRESESPQEERRGDSRWPYPVSQFVAFHDEHQQPTEQMLQPVRCADISMGGISLLMPTLPTQQYCTILLGRPPKVIYMRARVAQCQPPGDFENQWKIGCEFLGKVESISSG